MAIHVLERRAAMLAEAIAHKREVLADALKQPGAPPFTVQLSKREAFDWWGAHWADSLGIQARSRLTAEQDLELTDWMSEQHRLRQAGF